ncbi:Uncharacterised protein [Mycobacteroides abscessus subsp. abscessus]|nr:Uncharacterised protein [Mycobacteroides abscessus subsp. abscessus]
MDTNSSLTTAEGPVRCAEIPSGGGYSAMMSRMAWVDSMARAVPMLPARLIRT